MNAAREKILGRVRAAVRVTAPPPAAGDEALIWPPVGELERRFREEFVALKGEFVESLPEFLAQFARVDGPLAEREVGVTGCECLVAKTGSIVLSSRTDGGRVLSVLPPVHVVVARRDQIVPDLAAAMQLLRERYQDRWPSFVTVISGPSRTADIEKVLVMGAHGPKRLVVHFTT